MIPLSVALFLIPLVAQTPAEPPPDAEIRKMLADRIDTDKQGVGIVVGIVSPKGRRIVAYGRMAKDGKDTNRLGGDTVFEIGSMTKVFTSLVLMDMVEKGEVSLDDPVAKFLPSNVHVPERNGKKITLRELSTQTSGLPRMPDNFHPKDMGNPYADYTVNQLYEFVSGYMLTREPGEKYEYSNLAVGLLGNALARRAGMDYEAMVAARILKPLGMKDTAVTLSPEMKARLATGHNAALNPVPNWDIPALAGAGALRSTTNDMLTFLAANLGLIKTALARDMAEEVSVRRSTTAPNVEIAYAWHIFTANNQTIYWHNGGTGGYRTFMGYDTATRVGVVALSNASTPTGVDDIGHHLLDPAFPLQKFAPPKEHKQISLDSKLLEGFTGRYQIAPNFVVTISRSEDHLYAQATGQGKFEIFAEGARDFFAKVTELTVTFETNADGRASVLVLHQNGVDTSARRVD